MAGDHDDEDSGAHDTAAAAAAAAVAVADAAAYSTDLRIPKSSNTSENKSSSSSNTNKKRTLLLYEPETIQPEWLELPPELQAIDFTKDNAVAWDKYQPYSNVPPVLTPLGTPPTFHTDVAGHDHYQRALCFQLHAMDGRARAGTIHFPNSTDSSTGAPPPVPTPRFMPVGTKGTLKSVLPSEIQDDLHCPMILANTYHLALQPGTELIQTIFGGLPKFMGGTTTATSTSTTSSTTSMLEENIEPTSSSSSSLTALQEESTTTTTTTAQQSSKPNKKKKPRRLFSLLTDSGGFQMVSLAALSVVTENGVVFESPYTKGESMTLRPEDSIRCQNEIGADIIMQLDDVISSVENNAQRFRLATLRTLRWYDRCVQAHTQPESQNLYPILQGHLDTSKGGLREICLAGFRHRDIVVVEDNDNDETTSVRRRRTIPGFAIGGLAGGESKDDFWNVVDHACRNLPDDRPRYLMGVGYPLDLVVCTALGVDQYDCVYPTRTARFGVALVDQEGGQLKLKQHEYATQQNAIIMEGCPCTACSRKVSRARLHALLKSQSNVLGVQLLTQHNVCYMMGLVNRMRQAILEGRFQNFVRDFIKAHFANSTGDSDSGGGGGGGEVPQWVKDALNAAGIDLTK